MRFSRITVYLFATVLRASCNETDSCNCASTSDIAQQKALFFAFDVSVPVTLRAGMTRAVFAWAERLHLKPELTSPETCQRCLRFRSVQGDHGDGFSFIPNGLRISHVVSQPLSTVSREIHFNAQIAWKTGGGDPDVYTVALHEIGHVLGLTHSSQETSIMYPWYGRGRSILYSDLPLIQDALDVISTDPIPRDIRICTTVKSSDTSIQSTGGLSYGQVFSSNRIRRYPPLRVSIVDTAAPGGHNETCSGYGSSPGQSRSYRLLTT